MHEDKGRLADARLHAPDRDTIFGRAKQMLGTIAAHFSTPKLLPPAPFEALIQEQILDLIEVPDVVEQTLNQQKSTIISGNKIITKGQISDDRIRIIHPDYDTTTATLLTLLFVDENKNDGVLITRDDETSDTPNILNMGSNRVTERVFSTLFTIANTEFDSTREQSMLHRWARYLQTKRPRLPIEIFKYQPRYNEIMLGNFALACAVPRTDTLQNFITDDPLLTDPQSDEDSLELDNPTNDIQNADPLIIQQYGLASLEILTDHQPPEVIRSKYAQSMINTLGNLYMALGPGTHQFAGRPKMLKGISQLNRRFPDTILSYDSSTQILRFGSFAIASNATHKPEGSIAVRDIEKGATSIVKDVMRKDSDSRGESKPVAQETADIQEASECLLNYDHAIIRTRSGEFYLGLDDIDAVVTARTIQALAQLPDSKNSSKIIAKLVEKNMSKQELKQFQIENMKKDTIAISLRAHVQKNLRGLTNRLMITHEQSKDSFTLISNGFSIVFYTEPIEKDSSKTNDLRPIISKVQAKRSVVSDEATKSAHEYMQSFIEFTPTTVLTQADAVSLLTFVMSEEGKQAIRNVLKEQSYGNLSKSWQVIELAHERVKKTLGASAYNAAYDERVVKGAKSTGPRFVSGRIPDSTNWTLGRTMDEIHDHYRRV